MICPTCGQETDDRNQFCSRCGAPTSVQQAAPQAFQPDRTDAPPLPPTEQGAPAPPPPPGLQGQPAPPAPAGAMGEGVEPRQDQGQQGSVHYTPQGAQPEVPQQPPVVPAPMQPPYAQPTIQMPAQQPPAPQQVPPQGIYQQPAYGQGPYAQQPPYQPQAPYAQQAPYPPQAQQYAPMPPGAPQYGQPYAQAGPAGKRGSTVAGLLTLLAGAAVIASTFLPWVSASAMGFSATVSGYTYMTGGASGLGSGSFSLVLTGDGVVFFTGFFSLLLGVLVLVGGLIMLFRRRIGGVLTFIFALLATGAAAVDIAMIMTKMSGGSAGFGIWAFAGAAFVALVLGIVGLASSG